MDEFSTWPLQILQSDRYAAPAEAAGVSDRQTIKPAALIRSKSNMPISVLANVAFNQHEIAHHWSKRRRQDNRCLRSSRHSARETSASHCSKAVAPSVGDSSSTTGRLRPYQDQPLPGFYVSFRCLSKIGRRDHQHDPSRRFDASFTSGPFAVESYAEFVGAGTVTPPPVLMDEPFDGFDPGRLPHCRRSAESG